MGYPCPPRGPVCRYNALHKNARTHSFVRETSLVGVTWIPRLLVLRLRPSRANRRLAHAQSIVQVQPQGAPTMVETTVETSRLEALFARADIDDIELDLEADHSEEVVITFTERVTGDAYTVAASTLEEAADEGVIILDDRQAYRQLRANGFSGSDIIDLVGRPDLVELEQEYDNSPEGEAWRRGYAAGVVETGELYADAYANAVMSAQPAEAAVGEPVGERTLVDALRLIPIDGAFLALVMPTQIATD